MSEPAPTLHRWTRVEYDRMVETGVFHPEARLELLDGEIIEMGPQKSRHATAVSLIAETLRDGFGNGFSVREQMPLVLDDDSEPDVAVVTGKIRDYADHHPRNAALVVEVADTSLAYDRSHKTAVYARNAVPEYWLLDLHDRRLEIYRGPDQGAYAERIRLGVGETISPLAAPGLQVAIDALLP